ncbi:HPP family protein [Thermoplasma sp.]|uniref:HPP family protein n=1 Tax=Thermoplasma sp. TaxID=1973142 RepID=UPI0025FE178F|nr:HPP family protein [Thermoplasma sp.]
MRKEYDAFDRRIAYAFFLLLFTIIAVIGLIFRIVLLAPPFAVSAYLITVGHRGRFSEPDGILVSYFAVIVITTAFHITIGTGPISLYLTTIAVSAIITFTRYSHPPAIALAIFSYIVHSDIAFVGSSLIVVALLVVSDFLIHRIAK